MSVNVTKCVLSQMISVLMKRLARLQPVDKLISECVKPVFVEALVQSDVERLVTQHRSIVLVSELYR